MSSAASNRKKTNVAIQHIATKSQIGRECLRIADITLIISGGNNAIYQSEMVAAKSDY